MSFATNLNAVTQDTCMVRSEVFEEKGIPLKGSHYTELENCGGSTLETVDRDLPLDLDVKQPNTQRCTKRTCPCCNKSRSPGHISFVSPTTNLQKDCIDSSVHRASDSLSIFCRTGSLFNIPVNLRSSEFSFENLKLQRRTKRINDLTTKSSGNVLISHSGQLIFDPIEGTVMARALLKSSVYIQLGTIETAAGHARSRSVNTRKTKSSEFSSYTSGLFETQLQKPKSEVLPFRKQRSKSNMSEKVFVSGSGKNLNLSHQSSLSTCPSVSKGMLHCYWKSGIPYFVFSVDDGRDEVYVANSYKIESSENKAPDYMYLFRLRKDGKMESRNQDNNALGFVGKMKVSSSLVLNACKSRFTETEFVLFGSHDDHSREMQSPQSTLTKGSGLSKMIAKMFRSTLSFKRKSTEKIGKLSLQFEDSFPGTFAGSINQLALDFAPNLELAAIVVNDYQVCSNKRAAMGGWGLKFLHKFKANNADNLPESSFASNTCEESRMKNKRESARSVKVLVPSGFHGGPVTGFCGPSTLIDRWRSGGHCDCGGWDIGCPLTVLSNNFIHSETPLQVKLQEDCKSMNLFTQGANQEEPILKMVNMNESLHIIYFHPNLSALQSFSIGVAIIHTQMPDLYPKLSSKTSKLFEGIQ